MIIDEYAVLFLAFITGTLRFVKYNCITNSEISFVFDNRNEDVRNDIYWFEELRKLRVAHLKRELEHYDGSIGYASLRATIYI